MTDADKLAKVCADGFAALERCEAIAYTAINYIPLPRGREYAKQPEFFMGGAKDEPKPAPKRGPSPLTIDSPKGPNIRPPSGNKVFSA